MSAVFSQPGADGAFVFFGMSFDEGEVSLVRGTPVSLQDLLCLLALGEEHDSRNLAIESMNDEDPFASLRLGLHVGL